MTLWMVWSVGVTLLLATSAHVLEVELRARQMAGRWVWVGAAIGATTLQVWSVLASRGGRSGSSAPLAAPDALAGALSALSSELHAFRATPLAETLDAAAAALWSGATAVLLLGLLGGLWRLRLRSKRWPRLRVHGYDVLVSEDLGPAVVGLRSPRIVLPRRLLNQRAGDLRTICCHEEQHILARDTRLLAAATLLVAVVPWNIGLWWLVRRLRAAVELDCDRRVVMTGVPSTRYARLLLDLGADSTPAAQGVLALRPSPSLLERRLTMLTHQTHTSRPLAMLSSIAVAMLLVLAACETPAPTLSPDASAELGDEVRGRAAIVSPPAVQPPLVFVDGVEVDGQPALDDLDPDVVESIEVLKGSAAAERYGDRALGGVIHITLKDR